MNELSHREQSLVSLGAAIASNCIPCIKYHVPEARKAGLSDIQIKQAVRVADKVRRVPARMVLQAALARIAEAPSGRDETDEAGCGCDEARQAADSGCGG
jgi:4-carboxymuconolactone decarboxylase